MLIKMVPLVYLVWSKQNLLVKNVKTFREVNALLRKLFWKQIRQEYKLQLAASVRLFTQKILQIIHDFYRIGLVEDSLFYLTCKARKRSFRASCLC